MGAAETTAAEAKVTTIRRGATTSARAIFPAGGRRAGPLPGVAAPAVRAGDPKHEVLEPAATEVAPQTLVRPFEVAKVVATARTSKTAGAAASKGTGTARSAKAPALAGTGAWPRSTPACAAASVGPAKAATATRSAPAPSTAASAPFAGKAARAGVAIIPVAGVIEAAPSVPVLPSAKGVPAAEVPTDAPVGRPATGVARLLVAEEGSSATEATPRPVPPSAGDGPAIARLLGAGRIPSLATAAAAAAGPPWRPDSFGAWIKFQVPGAGFSFMVSRSRLTEPEKH